MTTEIIMQNFGLLALICLAVFFGIIAAAGLAWSELKIAAMRSVIEEQKGEK